MRRTLLTILAYSLTIIAASSALAATPEETAAKQDQDRLAEALATTTAPDVVTVFECAQPGLVSDKSKNDCVILDYGKIRAMLYYQGARGDSPKPVKAYRQHETGAWYQVSLPPRM